MSVTRRRRSRLIAPLVMAVLVVAAVAVLANTFVNAGHGANSSTGPSASPGTSSTAAAAVSPTPEPTITPTRTPEASASDTPEPTPTATATSTASATAVPSAPPVVVPTKTTARDPGGAWTITYEYPQFAVDSTPFAAEMNAKLKEAVQLQVLQWEAGPAASLAPDSPHPNTLVGSFTEALVTPSIASFRMLSVEDLNGAHPSTTLQTVTYDLASGQLLGLGDLFPDIQAGLDALSTESRTRLKAVLGEDYDPDVAEFGTRATADNFAAWAPTRQGLEITFREYQVGSYADGLPRIVVPWSALRQVLAPDGPMSALYSG